MSNEIVLKYKSLRPLNEITATNGLWIEMANMPILEQQPYWIQSQEVGNLFLYSDQKKFPNRFIEYVKGSQDDSVTTLYENNRVLGDRSLYIKARKELMNEIGAKLFLLPSLVTIYDEGRQRDAHLIELGTAQLLDILSAITGTNLNEETLIIKP